jgi:hypothetical protein
MKFNMLRARTVATVAGAALLAITVTTTGQIVAAQGAQAPAAPAQGGRQGGAPAAPAAPAQGGGRGAAAPQGPPPTPRANAPIDLVGTWVAVVTEDWRWRMVTPPKGDFASVPLNAAGQKVGNSWDPASDGSCQAYGAAGVMRMPTRLRISWVGENVLQIESDAGVQTRRLMFDAAAQPGPRSLQGFSKATWERVGGGRGGGAVTGNLMVTTTNTTGGWLRKNGIPYSQNMTMTEYFDVFTAGNGDTWLVQTQITTDPMYLNGDWITSNHFKKEADASKWSPAPCKG